MKGVSEMHTLALILFYGGLIVVFCALVANGLTVVGIIKPDEPIRTFQVGMAIFFIGLTCVGIGLYLLGSDNPVMLTSLPLFEK